MFCASITCKALHSLVPRYFTRTPARPGKTRGTRFAEAGKQHPQRGGVERGGQVSRGQPGGSARPAVFLRANREAGGRGRGRPGQDWFWLLRVLLTCAGRAGAPEPAPPGSPTAMERLTLPAGSAAAVDEYLEYRRWGGGSAGPGGPGQARSLSLEELWRRGRARPPSREERWRRRQGPSAGSRGLPESLTGLVGEAYIDCRFSLSVIKYCTDTQFYSNKFLTRQFKRPPALTSLRKDY